MITTDYDLGELLIYQLAQSSCTRPIKSEHNAKNIVTNWENGEQVVMTFPYLLYGQNDEKHKNSSTICNRTWVSQRLICHIMTIQPAVSTNIELSDCCCGRL
jgi:hypothetical protein